MPLQQIHNTVQNRFSAVRGGYVHYVWTDAWVFQRVVIIQSIHDSSGSEGPLSLTGLPAAASLPSQRVPVPLGTAVVVSRAERRALHGAVGGRWPSAGGDRRTPPAPFPSPPFKLSVHCSAAWQHIHLIRLTVSHFFSLRPDLTPHYATPRQATPPRRRGQHLGHLGHNEHCETITH